VIVEESEDVTDVVVVMVKDIMAPAFKGMLPEVQMVVNPVVRNSWG